MSEHKKETQQELRHKKRTDALRENLKKRRTQKQKRSDSDLTCAKEKDKSQ